jgi:hypothetical protein
MNLSRALLGLYNNISNNRNQIFKVFNNYKKYAMQYFIDIYTYKI